MKIILLSTDKSILKWKSLPKKLAYIKKVLTQTKNAKWEVEVQYKNIVPRVTKGRIDQKWYDSISYPEFRKGYKFVAIHMSYDQKLNWGIQPTLRQVPPSVEYFSIIAVFKPSCAHRMAAT